MSQYQRNLEYLNKTRVIYKQSPINDKPTEKFEWGDYYENGTDECYDLFRSKAKIPTYKSLKWHLYVLWYLNTSMDQDQFVNLAKFIANKNNGFVTFNVNETLLQSMIYDVSLQDLETPPFNKTRKIIFNDKCKLSLSEKLSIVGQMIGKTKKVSENDIYDMMLYLNDVGVKITVVKLANELGCTTRTIHRNMSNELKKEKELLNKNL
jgi:hypothetical protein